MFYSVVFTCIFFLVHEICSEHQINSQIDKTTKFSKLSQISKSLENDKNKAIESRNNGVVLKEYLHCNDEFTQFQNFIPEKSEKISYLKA